MLDELEDEGQLNPGKVIWIPGYLYQHHMIDLFGTLSSLFIHYPIYE